MAKRSNLPPRIIVPGQPDPIPEAELECVPCPFCFRMMEATKGMEKIFTLQVENHLVTCTKNPAVERLATLKALIRNLIEGSKNKKEAISKLGALHALVKREEEGPDGQPKQKEQ